MDKAYDYWLHQTEGIGNRSIFRLLQFYGSAEEIYHRARAGDTQLGEFIKPSRVAALYRAAASREVQREYEKLQEKGIRFLTYPETEYPARLKEIPDPPYGIYLKGNLPPENKTTVAVIGARECSEYGRFVARALGCALGENGIPVISGMARGIDGISQEAALEAGGFSLGVLGCGVDICYPQENRRLYDRLEQRGGLLSCYAPGTEPKPGNFPPRNRIVSGLADVLVVVEARNKSGTLITVDMALEQGREVYVVPGRITDRLSDGCNRLLRQGAGIVTSPQEFIREIWELFPGKEGVRKEEIFGEKEITVRSKVTHTVQKSGDTGNDSGDSAAAQRLLACLELTPKSVEQLCTEAGAGYNCQLAKQLLIAKVLTGEVIQSAPGFYALRETER